MARALPAQGTGRIRGPAVLAAMGGWAHNDSVMKTLPCLLLVVWAATAPVPPAKGPAPPAAPPLIEPKQVLMKEGVKNAYPHWSRDGSRILFQSNRAGTWQLFVMNADGSHETQLTRGDSNNDRADWSPDNRTIAFVSDRDGNEEIYVMAADGTGARNLSKHPASDIHPYWSPDGKTILFNSTRDVDRYQIYEVNPDGTGLRRLVVSDDDDTCARVSPAGDRILYLTNLTGGADDVIVRDRDGSHPRNITSDPQADGWPTWTPDGMHIVF